MMHLIGELLVLAAAWLGAILVLAVLCYATLDNLFWKDPHADR